jgi:hypothetical protein
MPLDDETAVGSLEDETEQEQEQAEGRQESEQEGLGTPDDE